MTHNDAKNDAKQQPFSRCKSLHSNDLRLICEQWFDAMKRNPEGEILGNCLSNGETR